MPRNRESAVQTKVVQVAFGLVLLGVFFFATKSMMFGSTMIPKFLVAAIVGISLIFALDKHYWLLSAFLFGFYDTIPHLRFTGAELGSLVLVSVFFVRMALGRDVGCGGVKPLVLAALPFVGWVCLVWSMNPTGMLIFGNSSIGGRYYIKIILAFLSMLCLSRMSFDEHDCKLLGYTIALGYVAYVVNALFYRDLEASFFGDRSHYGFLHLSFVAPLFLCRFTPSELLVRFWPFCGFLISFGLSVYSGNRTAAARPAVICLMASFFLKRDRIKTFGLLACASVIMFVLVVGHGNAWNLPFAIQRSLSFLPGKWDQRLDDYGFNDSFRAELRYWAREQIKANPWFGNGGFSLDYSDMAWTNANRNQESINLHILSRNWHNVWLGMAADFGIPLSVFWGLFMFVLMFGGYRGTKELPPGSWWQTMYLYFYLLILTEFLNFFFNGGHSSKTAQQLFLWAGLMVAVQNGIPLSRDSYKRISS